VPLLLTLITYCYASNLLSSEDIEAACLAELDVRQIVQGATVTADDLRQLRRQHRILITESLRRLFAAALEEISGGAHPFEAEATIKCAGEFARRRVDLAVLIDMAMSE
jgi:hypothetical protein